MAGKTLPRVIEVLIGTIYNETEDINLEVLWNPVTKKISYRDTISGNVRESDYSVNSAGEAMRFIYDQLLYDWDLNFFRGGI